MLLKKGDMNAFDEIYRQYSKRLYGFSLRYVKQPLDAEGIVQEVFIRIWETREKIDIYTFESFIFAIAYNLIISLLRRRVLEKKYLEFLLQKQNIYDAANIIDEIHYRRVNEKVQSLLNELSPRQKEIFKLSREMGMTHDEIARKLNISVHTVKNHLVTALSFLKARIDTV